MLHIDKEPCWLENQYTVEKCEEENEVIRLGFFWSNAAQFCSSRRGREERVGGISFQKTVIEKTYVDERC